MDLKERKKTRRLYIEENSRDKKLATKSHNL